MRLPSLVHLACLAFLGAAPAHANAIPPMSLESQFARADLVVVARLGERTTCAVGRERWPCAEILADVVLKGSPATLGTPRYLMLDSGIYEASIERMDLSGTNLMFLTGGGPTSPDLLIARPQYYEPVRARRSILPVDVRNSQ